MRICNPLSIFVVFLTLPLLSEASRADLNSQRVDWPQWRGLNRDGISVEEGLLKTWPEGGPRILWRVELGAGFSGISIAQNRAYTMYSTANDEFVVCLDATTGTERWSFRSGSPFTDSNGNGPRSTPTVDGKFLYVVSANGTLYALQTDNGEKRWTCNLQQQFKSKVPSWGFAGSVLIEDDLLLLGIGGEEGKSLAAFDKNTGIVRWTAHTDDLSYSSPIAITIEKVRQILFLTANTLISVAPKDGQIYWTHHWSDTINITTPVFVPPDKIFISSAYDKGAALLKMDVDQGKIAAQQIWMSRVMKNWFSSSVLYGDYIYGFDNAIFKCIAVATGEEQWKTRGLERGSLILADGHLIALGENGKLVLAEVTPKEYREKANAQVLQGKCWTPPTIAGGKLYLRNEKEIICMDISAIRN